MPLWKKLSLIMEMNAIAEIAEKIIELGKKYHIPAFIHYGEPLLESTQTFDIDYIQKTLKKLPGLVEPIIMIRAV
jgi:hypothetical protein